MITIKYLKPFYSKISGNQIRLVFAYQYLSIEKDGELFWFIPIEGKEILMDIYTKEVLNMSEVFVFQNGNRFIRLPLYQLMLVCNIKSYLDILLDEEQSVVIEPLPKNTDKEFDPLFQELHRRNMLGAIDAAIDRGDKEQFMVLTNNLKGMEEYYEAQ